MDGSVVLEPEIGSGAPDSPLTSDEADERALEELLDRVDQWDQAIRDRDEPLARRLLHPGFALELVQPVRSVMWHDVWLEMLSDDVVHEWEVEDQLADVDGDYAALLRRVRVRATVMGEDRSGIFVMSDLWRKVGGEWVVWRRHSTPLSPGRIGAENSR